MDDYGNKAKGISILFISIYIHCSLKITGKASAFRQLTNEIKTFWEIGSYRMNDIPGVSIRLYDSKQLSIMSHHVDPK